MQEKIIKTITDLIKIPSVSGNEKEIEIVLDYVKNFFAGKAIIKEFRYNNAAPVLLAANIKTDDFDLLIVGHLDVVPAKDNQFSPKIEENKLLGRGSNDMKSQIAVGMYNLLYAIDNKLPLKMGILITTDEETTSNGIKAFKKFENIKSKIVLDVDAGNLTTIIEKYKHSVGIKLTANGKNAHSSRPWNGENAIMNLIAVINELKKDFPEYSIKKEAPKDTWFDTMVVTYIESPKTSNVVPDRAEANLNFRLTDKTNLDDLKKLLDKACSLNNVSYEIVMASGGCYMDANSKQIQDYKKIAEEILGKTLKITHMNGATDARIFADNSIIIMHSTNGENVHGDDEFVETDSIFKLMEIQRKYIESLSSGKL